MDKKVFAYSLIAGTLTSALFAWFLQPTAEWVWRVASSSASSFFIELQNAAILSAALGKRDWVSVILLFAFGCIFTGLSLGALTARLAFNYFEVKITKVKESTKETTKFIKLIYWLFSLLLILFLYALLKITFIAFVDLQLNTSFEQRLNAIGPYITIDEEKQLRSNWALMKSRSDYEKIKNKLEAKANMASINLPISLYE